MVWKRTNEDAVGHGHRRRVDADAEREGDDRQRRERRLLAHRAQRVASVLPDSVEREMAQASQDGGAHIAQTLAPALWSFVGRAAGGVWFVGLRVIVAPSE